MKSRAWLLIPLLIAAQISGCDSGEDRRESCWFDARLSGAYSGGFDGLATFHRRRIIGVDLVSRGAVNAAQDNSRFSASVSIDQEIRTTGIYTLTYASARRLRGVVPRLHCGAHGAVKRTPS